MEQITHIHTYICALLIILFFSFSCTNKDKNTKDISFNNEIKKAYNHYKNDSLKRKALLFLSKNIKYHYSHHKKNPEETKKALINLYNNDGYLNENQINHIKKIFLNHQSNIIADSEIITADILISNIDHSFKVWKEKPWNKNLSFENFCEYILPYRVAHEPLENWKQMYYDKYNPILDSIYKGTDVIEAANALNLYIGKTEKIIFNSDFKYISPGGIFFLNHKWGSCMDMRDIMLYVFRSVGIPVISDFYITTPANTNAPHTWCSIFDPTGHTILARCPGIEIKRGVMTDDPPGKIYRSYFGIQPLKYKEKEIAPFFQNRFIKDVTEEYFGKNNIKINLGKTCEKYAYLGVQTGHRTTLIDIAPIHKGEVTFQNIQTGIIYQLFYYKNNNLEEAGYPIQLNKNNIRIYKPDTTRLLTVSIFRKYPKTEYLLNYRNSIIGSILESANDSLFKKKETVHIFKDSIIDISTLVIYPTISKPVRYIRYQSTREKRIQLAEMTFFEKDKASEELDYEESGSPKSVHYRDGFLKNINDRNLLTFYVSQDNNASIVCDLKRPVQLDRIEITPRTDDNFIHIGDLYELFYHNGSNGWKSLGTQIATKQELIYHNIPENSLLWLKDHTRGNEEQVFFIKNGKQIFSRDEVDWNHE